MSLAREFVTREKILFIETLSNHPTTPFPHKAKKMILRQIIAYKPWIKAQPKLSQIWLKWIPLTLHLSQPKVNLIPCLSSDNRWSTNQLHLVLKVNLTGEDNTWSKLQENLKIHLKCVMERTIWGSEYYYSCPLTFVEGILNYFSFIHLLRNY